jgi:hypothetical protein
VLPVVTVHTSGVNVQGALATASFVVVLMTPVFALTIFILRSFISQGIDKALKPVYEILNEHATAIAKLKGVEEGKRFMQAQQEQMGHTARGD